MPGKFDWKWIAIGVAIMIGLNLVAGFILAMVLLPKLEGATDVASIEFSGGQMAVLALVNALTFLIGGIIVGIRSAGRTVIEPGISAAIAVVLALLISGNFSLGSLIAGGLIPFLAGVAGGWYGERRQHRA